MNNLPLEEILDRALALDSDRRSAYLDEACVGDAAARAELESLLILAERFPLPDDSAEDADPSRSAQLPERIGRYPILGVVGAGGMGLVYRARDPELDREVALKRLPPGIRADSAELARFRREARVLARLRHPNIATVHSLESGDDRPFLTMELVPGRTLRKLLAEGGLPVERALGIGLQIAAAMEAAHAEGIIHRDLKPLNIQVGEADEAKVLDFGLAKTLNNPAAEAPDLSASVNRTDGAAAVAGTGTLTGAVMGTPGYISPEQLCGRVVGPPADVWAFGCVLFECLAGASPFSAAESIARVPTRLRCTLAPLDLEPDWSLLPMDLPTGVRNLLRSCLRAEPDERPDSASVRRVMRGALEKLAAPSLARRLFSRRGAVALAFLLVLIIGSVMIGRKQASVPIGVPSSTLRQLTFHGNAIACDLSPDGGTAAYLDVSGRLIYHDIATGRENAARMTTAATGDTIVLIGIRSVGLRWSPSGEELAVIGARTPADRTASTYVVARDSHRAVALCDADFSGIVWSPGGSRLAGTHGVGSESTLCVFDRTTGLRSDVPLAGPVHAAEALGWSREGWLYFRGAEQDSIYVVAAKGGTPRSLSSLRMPRVLPGADEVCYSTGQQLRRASLASDGAPADEYTVLADRLPPFGSAFSLAREGHRVLYINDQRTEAWLGEPAAPGSGDDGFRWERLVRESLTTFGTRFSPDGTQVALIARPSGERASQVQVLDLSTGTRETVVRDESIGNLDWSPDGNEMVYRSVGGMNRIRLGSGVPRVVPGPRDPMYIRWLPDGRIVYMEREDDMWRAYNQLDPTTGRITSLPVDPDGGTLFQYAVAPDGRYLAAAGNRGERDEVKVWLIDLVDGSERLFYDGWAAPIEWSADGRWIYLITELPPESANERRSRVLRVAFEDGEVEIVTDLPEPSFSWSRIDLSPDGKRIAYDQRKTGRDLWLIDIQPIRD